MERFVKKVNKLESRNNSAPISYTKKQPKENLTRKRKREIDEISPISCEFQKLTLSKTPRSIPFAVTLISVIDSITRVVTCERQTILVWFPPLYNSMNTTEEPEEKHPDSFHRSVVPLLLLGQICGLVPVQGISGPKMRFTWASGVHVYAFIIFAVTFFFDTCYTIDNLKQEVRIDVFASTVFYTVCLLTTLFFLGIAKDLPRISKSFAEVETQMMDYGYPERLGFKVKVFLFSFIFLAIIEHGTLVFINFKNAWINSGGGGDGFGYSFYHSHFPAITRRLSYSGVGTLILFWVNAMCTFNWNYLDFFIIVISMETYSRHRGYMTVVTHSSQITASAATPQKESKEFWEKITKDYNRLSLLTKELDRKLSKVILTSFFSNMYHLSLQLVRTLKISGSVFQMTYFYFSLTYLIVRLLLVLFAAAKVHGESRKPCARLSDLEHPRPEAVRLLFQVYTDDIAFTGNRFFVINERFVVSIVGTMITYQSVLLQFNSLKGQIY